MVPISFDIIMCSKCVHIIIGSLTKHILLPGGVQLLRLDVKAKYKPIYPKRVNSKKNNRINTLDLGRTGWKDEIFQIQNSFSFTWY